ncbi:hypothetical protein PoB_003015100 [Plakobranchus ocellatus]|uniref:Uncharacterized protein n=1 Tax=Plakobranchus ocellatus TaxID=259542 RepID=A0AAV4AAJ0_9GAST|nr:hypothetical protein PoB_003015100 [Plakobranchus ocellatus]
MRRGKISPKRKKMRWTGLRLRRRKRNKCKKLRSRYKSYNKGKPFFILRLCSENGLPGRRTVDGQFVLWSCSTSRDRPDSRGTRFTAYAWCFIELKVSRIMSRDWESATVHQGHPCLYSLRAKIGVSDQGKILRSAAPSEPSSPGVNSKSHHTHQTFNPTQLT